MKRYNKDGKVLYFALSEDADIHFVPTINWNIYLALRLNKPVKVEIFDTVRKAEDAATDYEGFFMRFPDTRESLKMAQFADHYGTQLRQGKHECEWRQGKLWQ